MRILCFIVTALLLVLYSAAASAQSQRYQCPDNSYTGSVTGSGSSREETLRNTEQAYEDFQAKHRAENSASLESHKQQLNFQKLQTTCDNDFRSCNISFRACMQANTASPAPQGQPCDTIKATGFGATESTADDTAREQLGSLVTSTARQTMQAYGWSEEEAKRRFTIGALKPPICKTVTKASACKRLEPEWREVCEHLPEGTSWGCRREVTVCVK